MTTDLQEMPDEDERTDIYKLTPHGEDRVGYIGPDAGIFRCRWDQGLRVGRVEESGDGSLRIFRRTRHDEKELGSVDPAGVIRSHGLFEGGDLGWLDPDGVVVQGGLILGEEEVGRVHGSHIRAAAAALLLIFLPEDAEASREMKRRG